MQHIPYPHYRYKGRRTGLYYMKYCFCTILLLLSLFAQAQQYDHHTIAILPFRIIGTPASPGNDSAFQQVREYENQQGILLQTGLFNSLQQDSARLAVTIQDYRITDSLLRRARIDPREAYWQDKTMICKWLKVDAVVTGILQHTKVSGRARLESDVVGKGQSKLTADRSPKRVLELKIFDGPENRELWHFSDDVLLQQLIDVNTQQLNGSLYKHIRKQFPYVL